ncbi:MAG: hypothetical protein KGR26_10115 [Cyanobacteria bacterium REEB65]|nr:hypothetical protein [Cyanobacteria bacterium REEB65]
MSHGHQDPDTPEPRTAKGKALQRSDQDLERLSEVSQWDINKARAYWEEHAPEDAKGLIEAEPEAPETRP